MDPFGLLFIHFGQFNLTLKENKVELGKEFIISFERETFEFLANRDSCGNS